MSSEAENMTEGAENSILKGQTDGEFQKSPKQGKTVVKYANRLAFSKFISQLASSESSDSVCCGVTYSDRRDLHRHINNKHREDISRAAERILDKGSNDAKWKVLRCSEDVNDVQQEGEDRTQDLLPPLLGPGDEYPWLPTVDTEKLKTEGDNEAEGRILLFYRYRKIKDTHHVKEWQQLLCQRLGLTGKVRVASEGLNATVGGSYYATEIYMVSVMSHPLFSDMVKGHFKTSSGGAHHFPDGLRVGIYEEAVPMGIKPEEVSYRDAGVHLTPEQFHDAVNNILSSNSNDQGVLIDCRNFYESKIGCFDGAVAPDIRKFSYWPEYVQQNLDLFRNRDVYMYCTGGIRCERGSAFLKAQGICKEVYQLEGGIHKYIEKYPNGYFKGKLFVFDDRYAIPANDSILSACFYCAQPWDDYTPCTSTHCHQLVLICSSCRHQGHTACCSTCQENNELKRPHEQCECTAKRARIPIEKVGEEKS